MSVKERLTAYIKFKGLSNRRFSLSLGMSENYVASMRKSIQPDVVQSIAVLYPDLNVSWLITGEGEMLSLKDNPAKEGEVKQLREQLADAQKEISELKDKLIEEKDKYIRLIEGKTELINKQRKTY